MTENENPKQQGGQSLIIVAGALVVLVIFVALTVDLGNTFYHRRTAQNGADGAALAGGNELGRQHNAGVYSDLQIHRKVNEFAELNDVPDTNGIPGDEFNDNVEAYYLYGNGTRILGQDGMVGNGTVPAAANGIEAVTHMTATAYFGGILGYEGYPVSAVAAVVFGNACGLGCVVPIATHDKTIDDVGVADDGKVTPCFNIWNGEGPGNFGWLNWSFQIAHPELSADNPPVECKQDDCSSICLATNLEPDHCNSGFVRVGDWTAGTTGVSNDVKVRNQLETYIGDPDCYPLEYTAETEWVTGDNRWDGVCDPNREPIPFTVVVWGAGDNIWADGFISTGVITDGSGCGDVDQYGDPKGLNYNVVGFAKMQLLGHQLSQGKAYDPVISPSDCVTVSLSTQGGNRLTAVFLGWVDGTAGTCEAKGTVDGLSLFK